MHVRLRNERTGELKEVKVGFSWTLLIFSNIFGIPLFMRRLTDWAVPMFVFSAMEIPQFFNEAEKWGMAADVGSALSILCSIYLGFRQQTHRDKPARKGLGICR